MIEKNKYLKNMLIVFVYLYLKYKMANYLYDYFLL